MTSSDTGRKQGQDHKNLRYDEIKDLNARLAAIENSGKIQTEPTEESPQAMFAALRSKLEKKRLTN